MYGLPQGIGEEKGDEDLQQIAGKERDDPQYEQGTRAESPALNEFQIEVQPGQANEIDCDGPGKQCKSESCSRDFLAEVLRARRPSRDERSQREGEKKAKGRGKKISWTPSGSEDRKADEAEGQINPHGCRPQTRAEGNPGKKDKKGLEAEGNRAGRDPEPCPRGHESHGKGGKNDIPGPVGPGHSGDSSPLNGGGKLAYNICPMASITGKEGKLKVRNPKARAKPDINRCNFSLISGPWTLGGG